MMTGVAELYETEPRHPRQDLSSDSASFRFIHHCCIVPYKSTFHLLTCLLAYVSLSSVVVYVGVDIELDPVSIPSVSKNHGHTWLTGGSLLAVAESTSYQCLRRSKNVPKVRHYFRSHFLTFILLPSCCCFHFWLTSVFYSLFCLDSCIYL